MILLYDAAGRITQTFIFVVPSLEEYAETVLKPEGKKYVFWDGSNPDSKYVQEHIVHGPSDQFEDEEVLAATAAYAPGDTAQMVPLVLDRPKVIIGGDIPAEIKAGQEFVLTVDQPVSVRVIANSQVVATESVDDGTIELSFDHPGAYIVEIGADFPVIETRISIEVA